MNQIWKSTVMGIVYALIVYIVASILISISSVAALISGLAGSAGAAGGFGAMTIIFLLLMIAGFVWFFVNLSKFIGLQKTDDDTKAITNVRTAYILIVIGAVLNLIPLIGWLLNLICQIVGYVLLIVAFGNFANSRALGQDGKTGANLLKVYAIISLICSVLAVIPFINILAYLGFIAAYVLLFIGWIKVSNDTPRDVERA